MVGTNGTPEYTVSAGNNFQKIMEEYGDEMIFMFVIGLIVGTLATCLVYEIVKFIKSRKENKGEQTKENEK